MLSDSEVKALWGRSGGRCAKCRLEIVKNDAEGRAYPIGDQAHVVGKSPKSPRGKSQMPKAERERAENRILLCPACHREVDRDAAAWPPERLRMLKMEHEERVRRAGQAIPMAEIAGDIDIVAVDAEEATGADIQAPTRILPGTRVGVRAKNVRSVTGVKVTVGGDRDV